MATMETQVTTNTVETTETEVGTVINLLFDLDSKISEHSQIAGAFFGELGRIFL